MSVLYLNFKWHIVYYALIDNGRKRFLHFFPDMYIKGAANIAADEAKINEMNPAVTAATAASFPLKLGLAWVI